MGGPERTLSVSRIARRVGVARALLMTVNHRPNTL